MQITLENMRISYPKLKTHNQVYATPSGSKVGLSVGYIIDICILRIHVKVRHEDTIQLR